MQNPKQTKIIFIGSIILFTALLIFIIAEFVFHLIYSATLTTAIAPSTATLTIDGKTYPINQDLKLKPSDTTAFISAEGFKSQEIPLSLIKNETTTLYTYLIPENDDLSWYYNNPTENKLLLEIGGLQASTDGKNFLNKYPITQILPIAISENIPNSDQTRSFLINYGDSSTCKSNFCLLITDFTGGNQETALNLIREKGYNPDDYEVIYKYDPPKAIPENQLNAIYKHYGVPPVK